ncbi:phenolphthiocerol synthesis polyketide synthase type I Pks15/1-like [Argopecten irradians]|uniref:phenolphthiocerol synthesis polyketide synthase type I Pks15/1-like n=1 Tax=Argopecten irradians TaxID=31199 RepID=UPI00371AA114
MEEIEEIAIVGIGCRFPGANNLKEFWKVLVNGENHVNEIPRNRWNLDAIYDPDPDSYGKTYVRRAGLLSDHDVWDNEFFGIAEKEASEMDPQQRYVLECVHMALEDGGITREELDGSPTSVYIGAMNSDAKTSKDGDYSLMTNYTVTGDAASIITARVSYNYNLLGPSLTIDTACSSSLVAVNLATQSLRLGESSMAICGGVNSILYPDMFVTLTKARMASPTGQCQAFSANADGYARGEGCGIVILERLSDALQNDRRIWATIRTGCNQDGRTTKPITAPSEVQQTQLLRDIYLHCYQINPRDVQYIEAHGTGTPIGDPVEVNSLGRFFKDYPIQNESVEQQRFIGSVKTNIGHLESGAGAASLIKTLLMMRHGQIVPSLHSLPRNEKIDFEGYALAVPTSVRPWPTLQDGTRAACINCFGFGGTNSHAFIRQWAADTSDDCPKSNKHDHLINLIPVSAKSQRSLIKSINHIATSLTDESCELNRLAYTASCKRDHYRYRKMFIVSSVPDLIETCEEAVDMLSNDKMSPGKTYRIVYVFCGVGTAWTKMGMELVNKFQVFAEALRRIDTYLAPLTEWSITDKIRNGTDMDDPFLSHIGIFACQVGLSDLWKHWGICPDAMVGQSVGEVAAAYSSGVLSLGDAVKVIYHRSRLLTETSGGKMIVVRNINTSKVAQLCDDVGNVEIAVHVSPVTCTISGDNTNVEIFKSRLEKDAQLEKYTPIVHDLNVKCAYHSRKVENAARHVRECLQGIEVKSQNIPIFSTVTGTKVDDFGSPSYWQQNVANPVLFHQAIIESTHNKPTIFLEIGPRPVLKAHLNDIFTDENVAAIPSMTMNSGFAEIIYTLSELYTRGVDLNWERIVEKHSLSDLPQYQFDGKHLMVESDYRYLRKQGLTDETSSRNLMLTQKETDGEFKVNFSPDATPFVYEHIIDDAIIIPGATYAEVGFELGMRMMDVAAECLHVQYDIIKAVPVSKGKPFYLDLTSEKRETNSVLTDIVFSITKEDVPVAKGVIKNNYHVSNYVVPVENVSIRTGTHIEGKEVYRELTKHGYKYGSSVQLLKAIIFNDDECTGYINLTEDVARQINQTSFHPAVLDAMLHSSALIFLSQQKSTSYKIYPIRIGGISVLRSFETEMVCYTRIIQKLYKRSITNIILTRPDGLILAEVKEIEHQIMDGTIEVSDLAYHIIWKEEVINTFIKENDSTKKMTICYEDSSVHNILRKIYPQGDSFLLRSVAENPAFLVSATKEISTVLFVPNSNLAKQSISGEEVFNIVYKNCEAFLKAMNGLKDDVKDIIVVTENTQEAVHFPKMNRSVFGSELWGFTRSLRQEVTKCRLLLIDVQPSIELEIDTLHKAIAYLSSDGASSLEYVISDGKLYSNFLQCRPQSGLQNEHRLLTSDTSLDLELRSTASGRIVDPFLIPTKPICASSKSDIILQVEEICDHSTGEISFMELDSRLYNSLWTDHRNGYPVISLEFQGTVVCSGRLRRVVACYPTRATNRISVPEQCVCDQGSLPMYTPGLITNALMMWSLMKRVKQKTDVCIVRASNKSDDWTLHMLCDMIQTIKRRRVHVSTIADLTDVSTDTVRVFIVLENLSQAQMDNISQPGITIIGYDDVLLYMQMQHVQMSAKGVNVDIIPKKKMFDTKHISNTFPVVTRWLKRRSDLGYNIQESLKQETVKLVTPYGKGKREILTKATREKMIHKNCLYVVVGGLTGLGWEIVKWLGYNGAGIVVSLSRKGSNPEIDVRLQNAMDLNNYKISTMRCDIANYSDVQKAFADIKIQFPNHPIKGIFQGAGVLKDMRIEAMTMDSFKEVLLPKVLGTWNLHLATKELLLDFFVMHSSTTSVFGNAGQTNYGAANSFLDSLALYRRANSLPGQSINWSALAVGMAKDENIKNNLEAQGYYVLETNLIKECLLDVLIQNPSQIVYGLFNWKVIGKNPVIMRNDVSNRQEYSETTTLTGHRHIVNTVVDIPKTMEASFQDQRLIFTRLLFNSISRVLAIDEKELAENQNLLSLGIESQKAVELIQIVKEATGCRLPVAYILSVNYSIGMIIDFVHSNIIDNFKMDPQTTLEVKSDVIGSPTWLEKFYIDMHQKNPHDSSLWFSVDFILGSGLSDINMWRTILRWITIQNPELRTVYQPTDTESRFGMKKITLDPDDAQIDIRRVDYCTMAQQADQDNIQYSTFDIARDPPLRVLYCDTGKKHQLRFIISHVSFDLQSFFLLVSQFQTNIEIYLFKKCVNLTPLGVLDIATLIEQRLDEERTFLEDFWRGELQDIQETPSISRSRVPVRVSEKTNMVSLALPNDVVNRLHANDFDITAAVLLFSLYQILLREKICISTIPVVMTTDMRQHFPELIDRILLGINYVPVITQFEPAHATLRDCISVCCNKVSLSSRCSMYPFDLIKQLNKNKENCFRHFFNVRDITKQDVTRRSQHSNYYMERVGFVTGFLNQIETALNVVTDRHAGSMELVLSYDTEIVSLSTAKLMVEDLSLLASVAVRNPDIHLDEIPLGCSKKMSPMKMNQWLPTETLLKETSKGWEHPAELKFAMVNDTPNLVWSNPDSKRFFTRNGDMCRQTTIPIPCILCVDVKKLGNNQKTLLLQIDRLRFGPSMESENIEDVI